MDVSYKAVVLIDVIEPVKEIVPERLLNHDDLLKDLHKIPKRVEEDLVLTENYFMMCEYIQGFREYLSEFGYMNTFSYKDVFDICRACISLEPIIEEESDEESAEDYDYFEV